MTEPMSDERLEELRDHSICFWLTIKEEAELFSEIDRLRAELAEARRPTINDAIAPRSPEGWEHNKR